MPYNVLTEDLAEAAPATTIGQPRTSEGETLASMVAELQKMLGNRGDIDDARAKMWINQAYVDTWTSLQLEEALASLDFPLVSGQHIYALPDVVATTIGAAIVDTDDLQGGWPLIKTDLYGYRRFPDEEGAPTHYFRLGNILVIYPTPEDADTLVLDFRSRPLLLVEDTDSPALGYEWHEVILLNARKKGFSALLEFDKAMPAENDYIQSVRRRRSAEADEDEGRIVHSSVPHDARMLSYRPYRTRY